MMVFASRGPHLCGFMKRETKETNTVKTDVSLFIDNVLFHVLFTYMFIHTYCVYIHLYSVLKLIPKLRDRNMYPTNLELLRVNLAATVFSTEVQDVVKQYTDDVCEAINLKNTDPLLTYMSHFWELLQLNNSVCLFLCIVLHFIHSFIVFIIIIIIHRLFLLCGLLNSD